MKKLSALKTGMLAACLGMAFGAAHADPVNLLSDGDFENFASQVAQGGYATFTSGQSIGAWTVGATSVDLIRGAYGAISNVSVDLSGTPGPGSLSQDFNAIAGQTYTLSFDYFKNDPGTNMVVSFGGQDFSYVPGSSAASATLNWTATMSGLQTVSFAGGNGNGGPTLDNVMLTTSAVPEPTTLALLGAGIGVMGFVARRRKPA